MKREGRDVFALLRAGEDDTRSQREPRYDFII